jgi:MFS transporter, ACS family, hexuronate transporter
MVDRRGDLARHTIINYLSRNALGVLAPTLKDQMGLSTEQYSYIVGAFQIGYTIMQPVCGLIVDAIGLRLGFALFATLWSMQAACRGASQAGFRWRARAA